MTPSKIPAEKNGFSALLQNRSFLWLWMGQALSQIADKILIIFAISLLSTYHVPASLSASSGSAIMIANTIPAIVFGAAAGILVDRYRKKQTMVLSNLLRAGLVISIVFLPKELVLLLLVMFAISTVTQVFTPAEQSITPLVVPPEHLIPANSLSTITQLGSVVVGFASGDWILSTIKQYFGDFGNAIFFGIIYLLAAGCCQMIRSREVLPEQIGARSYNPLPEFKEGLRYLRGNRLVQHAMVQLTILFATIAALQVLSINLVLEMGLKKTQFGLLVAATGVGLVIGAAVLGNWGNRLRDRPLPLVGFGIITLVLIGYILFKQLWSALLISTILGFGAALIAVPMQTLIQEKTPESMRGKVFGFQNNAVNVALSLPLAVAGPLADRFGINAVLIGMSMVIGLAGIWVWKKDRQILPHLP
jgi:MFS family permease